jgi:hypothetical protein
MPGVDGLLPAVDELENLLVEAHQAIGVFLAGGRVLRHVDAARIHHHRIDQAVDALDVLRALQRRFELIGQRCVAPRGYDGDQSQGQGDGGEQCKDRIKLAGNG